MERNENERRTSKGTDVGERSDELNVHNIPEHHLACHQKSVAVVDKRARAWLDVAKHWSKISIVTFMGKGSKRVTYVHQRLSSCDMRVILRHLRVNIVSVVIKHKLMCLHCEWTRGLQAQHPLGWYGYPIRTRFCHHNL